MQTDLAVLDKFVEGNEAVIVFTPTKTDCLEVWEALKARHPQHSSRFTIAHSDLSDAWIAVEVSNWKAGSYKVMVATSLASNVRIPSFSLLC